MSLSVPPFPANDDTPSPQKMSNLLICALPEPDRKTANDLLVLQILPVKLAGIEYHPRPQRLSVVVYKELARILSGRPANMRLHALKLLAVETELHRLARDSLHLAIARFLLGNTGNLDAVRLERWLTPPVQDLRALSALEIANQAGALAQALDAWKHGVASEYPTEWPKHRVAFLQAQATMEAARDQSFDRACSSLLEFLRDAGRDPGEITFT